MRTEPKNALKTRNNYQQILKTLQKKILVLGIGNLLLRDEGVGIHVINRLEEEEYKEADLMDGGTGGFHLLGFIESYNVVIIVDAALDEFPAGYVRILHPGYAKDFPRQLSAHEIGLKDLLESAFLLGNMPQIYLIAISIKDFQEMGVELTPEVAQAVPSAVISVKLLVETLQQN
jgi:hydrogenase maturation protease